MEKYRYKNDILVFKWVGDKSLILEIEEVIKPYTSLKVGISTDENILYVSDSYKEYDNIFTSTDYVRIGEFVVFDLNNKEKQLCCCNEEWLNKKYIKL
jgi:hypothetical protein